MATKRANIKHLYWFDFPEKSIKISANHYIINVFSSSESPIYVERSAHANVFKFNREDKRVERAKVNSRCFHWFSAAMLESLRRAATWRFRTTVHTIIFSNTALCPNISSSEYRTSLKLWHVVYLLLFYDMNFQFLDSIY